MAKEICDCKKGELEKIAETLVGKSAMDCCCSPLKSTVFYECTDCGTIYTRTRQPSCCGCEKLSKVEKYAGRLSKEQIINEAPKAVGSISYIDEERILGK
jgi:hypothetical protein